MANGQQNNEEAEVKEFLSRVEVRTMRKDLQKLREGVALKQREKVMKLKTPEEETLERAKQERIKADKEAQSRAATLEKPAEEEREAMKQLEDYATEEERQQIFYLKSEKANLTKQLQNMQNEQEPPLLLGKNKLLLERSEIEEKLNAFIEKERTIEGEQKAISESEATTIVPQDKQKLEQKRWGIEKEREGSEKERWMVEKSLKETEDKLGTIEEQYQKILLDQKAIRDKIEETNSALKDIYSAIMQREQGRKKLESEQRTQEALQKAEGESQRKEDIQRQQRVQMVENKEFLKSVPEEKKERLVERIQQSASKEEKDRTDFLKTIEEWAKEDKE